MTFSNTLTKENKSTIVQKIVNSLVLFDLEMRQIRARKYTGAQLNIKYE